MKNNQDVKILCICPSLCPEKLEKMLDSFLVTRSKHSRIIINHEVGSITNIFNNVFRDNPNEDYYHMMNDDCIYETPLWDIKLANKGKISYGNDGLQGENLPTFPMIDGDIIRALGYLQMPTLNRYCGDVVWSFIGKQCGILNYCKDVKITHKWHESQVDLDIHKKDMQSFANWLPMSFKDTNKVRRVL